MDARLLNVAILGVGFMLVFTAFQTMSNIQKVVLDSIRVDDPSFTGDGYTSLAIVYGVFSICNWLAPSAISITGKRVAMVVAGAIYSLFIASFLLPNTWLLYLISALMGMAAAVIWTAQGKYLSMCSDQSTITRNSGVFWAILQFAMFSGNLFVFVQFQGQLHIDVDNRRVVFSVLTGVGVLGVIVLATLRDPKSFPNATPTGSMEIKDKSDGSKLEDIKREFMSAVKLFVTRDMLLLAVIFLYSGLMLSFYSGVYSASVGFTLAFGERAKELLGLSGISIGVGEILGGVAFGLLGKKTARLGRGNIVTAAVILHIIALILAVFNLPNDAPLGGTEEIGSIDPPKEWIALLCAFLLGLGDACLNTQIYALLGGDFASNSAAAFALFKFAQSIGATASFIYSSYIGLTTHVIILIVTGVLGVFGFIAVERLNKKNSQSFDLN